jgi:alkane 1-monooxygenase
MPFAWQLEWNRLKKKHKIPLSVSNRMVVYSFAQLLLCSAIFYFFGWKPLLAFVAAATMGIILLETVNYIEHYGLLRKVNSNGEYEHVRHAHSWNSDHPLGRMLLFELSRHSDHHYKASKKYPLLDSMPESPQMPTGYPGMMVFSLLTPLWFRYINKRIDKLQLNSNTTSMTHSSHEPITGL